MFFMQITVLDSNIDLDCDRCDKMKASYGLYDSSSGGVILHVCKECVTGDELEGLEEEEYEEL